MTPSTNALEKITTSETQKKTALKATFKSSRSPLSSDTYNIVNGHTQDPRRPRYEEYIKSG